LREIAIARLQALQQAWKIGETKFARDRQKPAFDEIKLVTFER